MADRVQYELERSIEELEDLLDRGLLSSEEVRQVVSKRRDFEYRLQRRAPRKEDFLRYVDFEISLDKLRVKRKKRRGVKGSGVSDKRNRVHILYQRALRRFAGDLDLWHSAIRYAREVSAHVITGKRLGEAVKLHPRHVPFWVESARFHFEINKDASTARTLLQAGLRVNRDSVKLWAEQLRLEALYMLQIRQRRVVLGIDAEDADRAQAADATDAARQEVIYEGKILRIVYKNARVALPGSAELLREMTAALAPFFDSLIGDVARSLAAQMWQEATEEPGAAPASASRELLWEGRVRFELEHGEHSAAPEEAEARCVKLFEAALEDCPTQLMRQLFAEFLVARLDQAAESELGKKRSRAARDRHGAKLSKLLSELAAGGAGTLNEKTLLLIAEHEAALGRSVRRRAEQGGDAPALCAVELQSASTRAEAEPVLQRALAAFKARAEVHASGSVKQEQIKAEREAMAALQVRFLDICIADESVSFKEAKKAFLEAIKWCSANLKSDCAELISGLMRWVASAGSPGLVDRVYSEVKALGAPAVLPLAAFETVAELKRAAGDVEGVRELYRDATRAHPAALDLWVAYVKFEREHGSLQKEKAIMVRAMQLVDRDALLSQLAR